MTTSTLRFWELAKRHKFVYINVKTQYFISWEKLFMSFLRLFCLSFSIKVISFLFSFAMLIEL